MKALRDKKLDTSVCVIYGEAMIKEHGYFSWANINVNKRSNKHYDGTWS